MAAQKSAKKYLTHYIGTLVGTQNKKTVGLVRKKAYKNVMEELQEKNLTVDYELYGNDSLTVENNLQNIWNYATASASELSNETFPSMRMGLPTGKNKEDVYRLLKIYNRMNIKSTFGINMRDIWTSRRDKLRKLYQKI